jgi:AcrR family transcriptional regulator
MVTAPVQTPRERLLVAAAGLFASQGYRATSVADIQLTAGLTAGSGALYKHFASKKALLAEVVGTHVATMRQGRKSFTEAAPEQLEPALRFLVNAMWTAMHHDHQVLRVMLRDLDRFPELLDQVWAQVRTCVYDELATWLCNQRNRGAVEVADPEATAAVLLASLTYYPILDILIGHTPGDLEPARYTEAWVSQALAALRPTPR